MNCCTVPSGTFGFLGVMEMEVSVTDVTVSEAVPVLPLEVSVAVMVVVPAAIDVASPCIPDAFEMVAVAVEVEVQETLAVMSFVLESL